MDVYTLVKSPLEILIKDTLRDTRMKLTTEQEYVFKMADEFGIETKLIQHLHTTRTCQEKAD